MKHFHPCNPAMLTYKPLAMRRTIATLSALIGTWLFAPLAVGQQSDNSKVPLNNPQEVASRINFGQQVRPILADQCFHCHGPDPETREAGLRLDTREGLLGPDDSGGAVSPGDPESSELLIRISSDDPDLKMPPASSHKSLTPEDVELIRTWIQQGAIVEAHWSFQPIADMTAKVPDSERSVTQTIDFLIDQRLDQQNLAAAPMAEPSTLLRRLHFDLVGLPPQPEQVQSFVNDPSDLAYAKQVDRLLSSPHYGERMAIGWLDLVRYADSVGYHGDQEVSVSPYRDYVIDSFNDNLPFDQFTVEQLAGDLLPNPTRRQKIASGYNRLGMMSAEGGVQPKEYLAKYIAERVRNVSGTWLGLTMGCCECHDHKYDPISTREFYQMEAFFADIKERGLYAGANRDGQWGPTMPVPTDQQARQLEQLADQIAKQQAVLNQSTPELEAAQTAWETNQTAWTHLHPAAATATNGSELVVEENGIVFAKGKSPATEIYTLTFSDAPTDITAFRLEVLPDDRLPNRGPGRAGNGNFVLSEFAVSIRNGDQVRKLEFETAVATFEQTDSPGKNPYGKWAVLGAIDNDAKGKAWGWAIMNQTGKPQSAVFVLQQPAMVGPGDQLQIELRQQHENPTHTLGKFQIAAASKTVDLQQPLALPDDIATLLNVSVDDRTEDQKTQLAAFYRTQSPLLDAPRAELQRLQQQQQRLNEQVTTTLITESVEPRSVRVLPRGNWMDTSGDEVLPGFPAVLQDVQFEASNETRLTRLDLAHWLISPDHPLTARVFVNRVWKQLFGEGLAANLDDFGAQGSPPTHPELLDFLARSLIDSGWDVKALVRSIVMTRAYRRSSRPTSQLAELDSDNHFLARQNRFRLDAELVRDNALAVSGLLVPKIGGPSVKPYQPAGYWAYLNFPPRKWQADSGEKLYRRGLYLHWQRQYLHPSLLAFDAPNREECTAERAVSNTPLQSLVLLNDPGFVEAARAMATSLLQADVESDEATMQVAFERCLSRPPTEAELDVLNQLLTQARTTYQDHPELAEELLSVGQYAPPTQESLDRQELAAWTSVARALLNLNETITRY